MKKFITLVLVLAMVAIVALPASASITYFDLTSTDNRPAGMIYHKGAEVGNVFGNRVTITCGEILFPGVGPGNYTPAQLEKIAKTWLEFEIRPNGMLPTVFAGGLTINGKTYNEGVAAFIGGKNTKVVIRNGELVLWNLLEDMHADIAFRMEPQIREGNLDIHHKLAFKACSVEIRAYFNNDLLRNNRVEIIDTTLP